MRLYRCCCGTLVYYRREVTGGARFLCEYDHDYILPGQGEASGLDWHGRAVQGAWANKQEPGAVEVTPYHLPRCSAEVRQRWLPYADG